MNETSNNDKLDWMYKGSNSLVDREEYLLGRSVDKTLEQLNAEEKEKKLGIVPPKNHVEHECIPPSIRDFNKIVQAEQVDLSAKLQEDPLVAIKKREEEARRQFLQNPVQLKKLQDALKAQELKKKAKHKKTKGDSDSDIDKKIAKKLKYLKSEAGISLIKKKKKSKESALDTILMHKFNELKDKLSQEDLNDILAGKVSDSDEEVKDSDEEVKDKKHSNWKQRKGQQKHSRRDDSVKKTFNKRKYSSSNSESSEEENNYRRNKKEVHSKSKREYREKNSIDDDKNNRKKHRSQERKRRDSTSEDTDETESRKRKDRKRTPDRREKRDKDRNNSKDPRDKDTDQRKDENPDQDLENKILEKLRMLRKSVKSKRTGSSSNSDSERATKSDSDSESRKDKDSDSEDAAPKSRAFGLVKADGTKIALSKKTQEVKKNERSSKVETVTKLGKKEVKRLTEEEKQQKLREMMKNAEQRDKERSDNLRKYREEDKREEKRAENFDKDFMYKQLLHSTKEATVESRIKSNLNNIQRSSRHMDTHFSRR